MPGFFRGVADRGGAREAVQPAKFGLNNRGRVARLRSARIAGAFYVALSRIAGAFCAALSWIATVFYVALSWAATVFYVALSRAATGLYLRFKRLRIGA